jgi:hypothetical protein
MKRYLRFKSFQRFTETYNLLERAAARGLFRDCVPRPAAAAGGGGVAPLRVASIGGGPAYELLAFREVCPPVTSHGSHGV